MTVTSDHISDAPADVTIQVTSVDREALGELVVSENMRALVHQIQVTQFASRKRSVDNAVGAPSGVVQTLKTLDALAEPHIVPRVTSVDHKAIGDLIANNAIARVVGVEKTSRSSPVIGSKTVDQIPAPQTSPRETVTMSAPERVREVDDDKHTRVGRGASQSSADVGRRTVSADASEKFETATTIPPAPPHDVKSVHDERASEQSPSQETNTVQTNAPVQRQDNLKPLANLDLESVVDSTPAFAGSVAEPADEFVAPTLMPTPVPAQAPTRPLGDLSEHRRQGAPQSTHPYVFWAYRVGKWAAFAFAGWFLVMTALIVLYRFVDPPLSSLMIQHLAAGKEVRQTWRSLDEISPNLVKAVIVSEDWRFCQHRGIDIAEIRAAIRRSRNGIPRGASTMSMQVAKNLFLWPSKSYIRKALEVPLTLTMELVWPKWRMAEIYLNIVEWGPGRFGAHEAARYHFKRPASRLSSRQAALLAVSLPNPIKRRAGRPGPGLRRLASVIQGRMKIAGSATKCVLSR